MSLCRGLLAGAERWRARVALTVAVTIIGSGLVVAIATAEVTTAPLVATGVDVVSASSKQVTYRILVGNHGGDTAAGLRVSSAVPTNTTFESASPATAQSSSSPAEGTAACDNRGVREKAGTICEWHLDQLSPGTSTSIDVTYNLNPENVPTYGVVMNVEVSGGNSSPDSDSDATLRRTRVLARNDTFVDSTALPDTGHGQCRQIRVTRDGTTAGYIDLGPLPTEDLIERFWGAELRLQTDFSDYSPSAPGRIGIHRITEAWTEGTGGCAGNDLTTNETDARTDDEPASTSAPTSVVEITGSESGIRWDVTNDLATLPTRSSYRGWKLTDQGSSSSSPDGIIEFDSKETQVATEVPGLFIVHSLFEPATCIDVDPETETIAPGSHQLLTAYVTDGVRIPSGVTGTAQDACNGAPVAGKQVIWTVERDAPDVWISEVAGVPTTKTMAGMDAQPNMTVSTTDATGHTSIHVLLDEPDSLGMPPNVNRVSGRLEGTPDVPEKDQPSGCNSTDMDVPPVMSTPACGAGEGQAEDDAVIDWDLGSTASPSTSGDASSSPSASPTISPSSSVTPSETPSPTLSPSPTPSVSPPITPSVSPSLAVSLSPSPSPSSQSPSPTPSSTVQPAGTEEDRIDPRCGDSDVICGTDGSDIITGTDGDDVIICGRGDDVVDAGRGNDSIICGGGADEIRGGVGTDRIKGGGGNDTIHGGAGADVLVGGGGSDTLDGDGGRDRILGGRGRDVLKGGAGRDVLKGGAGIDTLGGGRGTDVCRVGRGGRHQKKTACESEKKH